MEFINDAQGAPKPVGAYSQAVEVGGLVFLAGQIGIDPATGELVAGGIEAQTKQVLTNVRAVLTAAGSSPDQIVMATVFLAEISDSKTVNGFYAEFVNIKNPPARQTVSVKALPMGALIEISVIAAV